MNIYNWNKGNFKGEIILRRTMRNLLASTVDIILYYILQRLLTDNQ